MTEQNPSSVQQEAQEVINAMNTIAQILGGHTLLDREGQSVRFLYVQEDKLPVWEEILRKLDRYLLSQEQIQQMKEIYGVAEQPASDQTGTGLGQSGSTPGG